MLINKVTLYSPVIKEMKDFYINHLGFTLLKENKNCFEIKVGNSVLEIKQSDLNEKPFYHFAINIPSNQFKEAKKWAKSKVVLNKEDDEDEVYFDESQAHSFYFLDPSENIVEFASRQYLTSADTNQSFTVNQCLNISEINITTENVTDVGNQLIQFGISPRNGEPLEANFLNFMGEFEDGAYLLLGPKNRRWFFSKKYAEPHPLFIQINHQKNITVDKVGNIYLELETEHIELK